MWEEKASVATGSTIVVRNVPLTLFLNVRARGLDSGI